MKLTEFVKELDKWREKRNLTKKEQLKGLLPNVLEELGELGEAIRHKDTEAEIDAMLDILVFFLNALDDDMVNDALNEENYTNIQEEVYVRFVDVVVTIPAVLKQQSDKSLILYIVTLMHIIKNMGYDFELCLDEIMKALHSRKGIYDDKLKKFIKDNSPKYEPDYKKAKL